jgi:hypothetical protein
MGLIDIKFVGDYFCFQVKTFKTLNLFQAVMATMGGGGGAF